jgi:hypothetical protein
MTSPEERREALTLGLVGEHIDLYQSSATFRLTVDQLVQLLPLWVKGIAERAQESDREIQAAIQMASRTPSPLQWPLQ